MYKKWNKLKAELSYYQNKTCIMCKSNIAKIYKKKLYTVHSNFIHITNKRF